MKKLLLMLLAALAGTLFAETQTVFREDFQNGNADKRTGTPAGWNYYHQWKTLGSLSFVTEDGKRIFRIDDASDSGEIGIARRFKFAHGKHYRLTVNARAVEGKPDSHVYAQITFFTGRAGASKSQRMVPVRDGKFHPYVIRHRAPEGATAAVVYIFSNKLGVGAIDLQDVQLEVSDTEFPAPPPDPATDFGGLKITPRDLRLTTDLASVKIVYGPGQEKLAGDLQRAVTDATGKAPELVPDRQMHTFRRLDAHHIMIGNKDTNDAVEQLYCQHHVILDATYPGPGGYVVRSCHDPFGDGHNVIFAGGSDEKGTREAVARLAERIRKSGGKLGFLADIRPGRTFPAPDDVRGLPVWDATFGWNRLSKNLAMLYLTNEKKYADEFLRLAFPDKKAEALLRSDDEDFEDPSDPLVKPYHYRSIFMILYWDMVEENPYFTDAQRAAVTRKFFEQLIFWKECGYQNLYHIFNTKAPHTILGDRHYLWETVSVYVLARYFDWHYPCFASKESLRVVRDIFAPLELSPALRIGTMEWYATFIESSITYAVLADARKYHNNPVLRAFARTLLAHADLTAGDWAMVHASPAMLGKLAVLLDDESFAELSRRFARPRDQFRLGQSFYPVRHYRGNMLSETCGRWTDPGFDSARMGYPFVPKDIPLESISELQSYRQKIGRDSDFLLLDTKYDINGRSPFHNFNISSFVLAGAPVLRGYPNQVHLLGDGLAAREKAFYTRVLRRGRVGTTAHLAGLVPNFNGHDWTRVLVLRENRFLLTVDTVTPRRDTQSSHIENSFCGLLQSGFKKTPLSEFHLTADAVPPKSAACPVSFDRVDLLDRVAYDNKKLSAFLNGVTFLNVPQGTRLVIPFELEKERELDFRLNLVQWAGQRGGVRLDLDGETIPGDVLFRANHYLIRPVATGFRKVAAGRHEFGITAIEKTPPTGTMQVTLLSFCAFTRDFKPGVGGHLIAATDGTASITPVSRIMFSADKGLIFAIDRPGKAGEPIFFETLIRKGEPSPKGASAARRGNTAAFRLPETALLTRRADGGFTVAAADWEFGYQVRDVRGKFQSATPFDYEYTPGKLVISRAENTAETHTVTLAPPDLAAAEKILAEGARNAADIPDVKAPFQKPVWSLALGKAPAGAAALLPGNRAAVACGKEIAILRIADGAVERRIAAPAAVGPVLYWAKPGLLVAGCVNEKLCAWKLDGTPVWSFTSEMCKYLAGSGKFYWYKSVYPGVYALLDAELEPGKPLLFAGSAGTTEILDPAGKLVARLWDNWGAVTRFAAMPGENGQPPIVLGERHMGAWPNTCFTAFRGGKLEHGNYRMFLGADRTDMGTFGWSSIGRFGLQAARLEPNGPYRWIGAFNGSQNRIGVWDRSGDILHDADLGPGRMAAAPRFEAQALSATNVTALITADLDGTGHRSIVASTSRGSVMIFDAGLKLKTIFTMPEPATALAAAPGADGKMRLLLGLRGRVVVADKDGRAVAKIPAAGGATVLLPTEKPGEILACTGNGNAVLIRVP